MRWVWLYVCSKHVIFKAIEVTREHLVWASTLAGAQDTPRPLVMQIRKRLPASPHSKSLLLEWGLALQSEVLEDEGGDLKTILFPASHACQEKCNPRKDLKTEDADLCFGVQHMLVGNLHAGGCSVSYTQNTHMPVEIFMYMNLNFYAARCVLIIKTQML